jgi:UMF1 family MFS transporter
MLLTMSGGDRDHRRAVRAWCLYDWANSAFATTVMAAMYPPFFRTLAVNAGISEVRATALWGYTSSLALALVCVVAPLLGAIADHAGARKRFLATFALVGAAATAATVLNGDATWGLAAALYLIGSIGFAGGNVFYESLLPGLASADEIDRVSARGYALGYLGGGLLLVVNAAWVLRPGWFGFANADVAVRAAFASVAVWWVAFSIPLLRRVPEPPAVGRLGAASVGEGFRRLGRTFREVRQYRHLVVFLVAFWVYNDGISTIIKMATAYGHEIGIGVGDMVAALVITQLVGFPCALAFGALAPRFGAKRLILVALGVYAAISASGYFLETALHFYILAALVGTVQGGSQALSRSLYATMVPRHKTAEFFGFYSASAKFAGILGPLLFGVVSELMGTSRLGIVALLVFFGVGAAILARVDVASGAAVAREAERRAGLVQ